MSGSRNSEHTSETWAREGLWSPSVQQHDWHSDPTPSRLKATELLVSFRTRSILRASYRKIFMGQLIGKAHGQRKGWKGHKTFLSAAVSRRLHTRRGKKKKKKKLQEIFAVLFFLSPQETRIQWYLFSSLSLRKTENYTSLPPCAVLCSHTLSNSKRDRGRI